VKISILSAVFNEAAYLPEMLASVRAQSHQDWELLFVSDGSTDATDDLVRAAAREDDRVRLVASGQKIGKVAAFNRAYEASTGEVVILLAGDDVLTPDSLEVRAAALSDVDPLVTRAVAFFKLRTMSEDPKHDGMTLPRGASTTSHSGGTLALTRALGDMVFPIPASLVSEDPWLSRASEGIATTMREVPAVVLRYRIHEGNSNPRMRPFDDMSEAMAARHEAWRLLLECERLDLSATLRSELEIMYRAELLRRQGKVLRLLNTGDLRWADRAAFASMADPRAFAVRQRYFRALSGWRGR